VFRGYRIQKVQESKPFSVQKTKRYHQVIQAWEQLQEIQFSNKSHFRLLTSDRT
jgi:hypothetical protein